MQRSLRQVFIRGSLGAALSVVAVVAAATQAVGFEGEIRLERGAFVLVDTRASIAQCLEATRARQPAPLAATGTRARG